MYSHGADHTDGSPIPPRLEEATRQPKKSDDKVLVLSLIRATSANKNRKLPVSKLIEAACADDLLRKGREESLRRALNFLLNIKGNISEEELGNLYAGIHPYTTTFYGLAVKTLFTSIPPTILEETMRMINRRSRDTEYCMFQNKQGTNLQIVIRLKKPARRRIRGRK